MLAPIAWTLHSEQLSTSAWKKVPFSTLPTFSSLNAYHHHHDAFLTLRRPWTLVERFSCHYPTGLKIVSLARNIFYFCQTGVTIDRESESNWLLLALTSDVRAWAWLQGPARFCGRGRIPGSGRVTQLQLQPIRELFTFSITNKKARSGTKYIKGIPVFLQAEKFYHAACTYNTGCLKKSPVTFRGL